MLITGAGGFAGGYLVEHYLLQGYDVHGTVHNTAPEHVPANASMHRLDLLDAGATAKLVHAVQPHIVHHLAAQSSTSRSWDDPVGTLTANSAMQFYLLQALVLMEQPVRVLVVGSCDEYGMVAPEANPVQESHPLRPATPYALSKVAQDLMVYGYTDRSKLDIMRVRPFLQLGPGRSDAFVAGSFARQVAEISAGTRSPMIETGNIDLQRDFTDVRDVVQAYALAVEQGASGEVYNIASTETHSLRDMLNCMLEAAGVEATIQPRPDLVRSGEAPLLSGDAGKLRAATGWTPKIPFRQSAHDTLAWWQERIRANQQGRESAQ